MSTSPASENEIKGVNIYNWKTWPFNRLAFDNLNDIIPTNVIEKDASYTSSLKNTPNASIENILQLHLLDMETDAIVILHKGEIAYEYYANGNDRQTPHILMSATKSVVGLIAGMLECKGVINLNATVSVYLPQIKGTVYEQVTLRQLLDMRAGVILNKTQQDTYDLAGNWEPISDHMRYHNGWYVDDKEPKMIFATGIFGQNLFVDRANNIVIAKLSSWKEATDYRLLPLTHRIAVQIRRSLIG